MHTYATHLAGVASVATSALRGTAQAVSAGASRVVSWSYKPALWTAAELASERQFFFLFIFIYHILYIYEC